MALRRHILSFFFLLACVFAGAQRASGYFQQEVNYTIQVQLDDVAHFLHASEKISYTNNSPDYLSFLYFHLWPNAYKNNSTALAKQIKEEGKLILEFAKAGELGWIDSLDFKVNGEKVKWEYDAAHPDICKLFLNAAIKPGEKIEITTPFRVKLPSASISRLGHIGQAYAITQWYPKPAVYDVNGWNQMPYLDQGEFYSEWGSFDVSITLPKNYVVGATGDLENGQEEIKWLNQKVKQTFSKIDQRNKLRAVKGAVYFDSLAFPRSSAELKTLRYKQSNVHDFAWFADKRFNVLKGVVTLPHGKRDVTCWALFTDNNFDLWTRSIEYLSDATFFYSLWNGDYQYNQVTAVDGTISAGGGMEYPNITIIGEASSDFELENVIMHEVGHNWFYGMLGSNERLHAWMDEGINSFNELRYMRNKYPRARLGAVLGRDSTGKWLGLHRFENAYQYYFLYAKSARENKDQPDEQHAALFSDGNYGAIVYCKTAVIFDYLFHYMGEQKFDEAMKFYFEHFRFSHPYPADLRKTLEYFSGKDLSWCFDDLIGTTKKLDYKILDHRLATGNMHEVLVRNTGEIKGPVLIGGLKGGKLKGVVWYDGFEGEKWLGFPASEVDEFMIDPWSCMPEINRQNNRLKLQGLLKRVEPLQLKLAGMLDDPRKTQLFYMPLVGYNSHNGVMAGLYLHNNLLFEKKFEFDIAPLFGFQNMQPAGLADLRFNFHPKNIYRTITAGVKLKRFSYANEPLDLNYNRIENYCIAELKNKSPRSPFINRIGLHYIYLSKEEYKADLTTDPVTYSATLHDFNFTELRFSHVNSRPMNNYSLQAVWQAGARGSYFRQEVLNKLWAEFKFHWTMNRNNNGFDFRIFAGKVFTKANNVDGRFRMGGIKGYQDYTFQYLYFGRMIADTSFNAQQYVEADGAFKTRMFTGQSYDYMLALNIKTPRLLKAIGLFADFGTCGTDGLLYNNKKLMFDFGVNIDIAKEAFNIYIPLAYSQDIKAGIDANGWNFLQRIMINVRLDKLNPKQAIRDIVTF